MPIVSKNDDSITYIPQFNNITNMSQLWQYYL